MSNIKHSKVSIKVAEMIHAVHRDYKSYSKMKHAGHLVVKARGEIDVFFENEWFMKGQVSGLIFDVSVSAKSKMAVNRINAYFDLYYNDENDSAKAVELVWKKGKAYALNHKDELVELSMFFYNFEELYKLRNGYSTFSF